MPQRFYPAVLERGERGVVGLWFPDFPEVAVAGHTEEEALARAADALGEAMRSAAEREAALPAPTSVGAIELPEGCDVIGIVAVGATPPDPSERVNVYLPRSLIEWVDRIAAEMGMNRSSFFGLAISRMMQGRTLPLPYTPRFRPK